MQRKCWRFAFVVAYAFCSGALGAAAFPPERPFDPRPLMPAVRERAQSGRFRFVVLGDSKNNAAFPAVIKLTDSLKPDLVLTTGDLVDKGSGAAGAQQYDRLAELAGEFMRRVPTWPVLGNHELNGGNAAEARANFHCFFGLDEENYAFDLGPARFIALQWPAPNAAGRAWLERQLEGARGRLIFVLQHDLYYTAGSKLLVRNAPDETTRLFTRYGVTAVFQGHDHGYYRAQRDGVWYITSAGAGAEIYRLARFREARPDDVFYGRAPASGSPVGEDRYWLHRPGGLDRTFDSPRYFVVVVDVDGSKVTARALTTRGEALDALTLKPASDHTALGLPPHPRPVKTSATARRPGNP